MARFVSELELLVLEVSLGATGAKERLFHTAAVSVVPCHVDHSSPDTSCMKDEAGVSAGSLRLLQGLSAEKCGES